MKTKPSNKKPKPKATPNRRSSVKKTAKKKTPVPVVALQEPDRVVKPLIFETPYKGFRPFEFSSPASLGPNEVFEMKSEVNLDKSPLKKLKTIDQPDLWSAGIENVTYVSNEFDFPSFPIQY